MPTIKEVVRDHRQHYLDRKLARSPLLHFSPGTHRVDICELFRDIQPNLPISGSRLHGVSTPESLIRNLLEDRFDATIHAVSPALLKKLERIQKVASDSLHSTGQHTLYLAYPCIVLPAKDRKSKLAPVMLFAVSIGISSQKLTIKRVLDVNEDGLKIPSDTVLNRLLAAYVDREFGISLAMDQHRVEVAGGAQLESQIQRIFSPWPRLNHKFHYPDVSPVIGKIDATLTDPYIADYAILGLAEFSGQALLDDLDEIEKAFDSGVECPLALARLIKPASGHQDNEAVEPASETQKWLVEKSDPSQERVVWAQKSNELVVLQGPPGTGKSQTIVNIVADALAQKKTVMVVCQKRAAIEVVHKRLTAAGLGDLAVLVDDVDKDRLKIIRRIDKVDHEFTGGLLHARDRDTVSMSIQSDENRIDHVIAALNDRTDGVSPGRMRFGDIQSQLQGLNFSNPSTDWSSRLKQSVVQLLSSGLTRADLQKRVANIDRLDSEARRLRYGVNTWSDVSVSLEKDQALLLQIPGHLKAICALSEDFSSKRTALHHDTATHWIAEHPWMPCERDPFPIDGFLAHSARAEFAKFQHWLRLVREIETVNPRLNSRESAHALRTGMLDAAFFQSLKEDSQELRSMVALRSEINCDSVLSIADVDLISGRGSWSRHIHALALHSWLNDLLIRQQEGMQDASRVSALISHLASALANKRQLDALNILANYQERVGARNELKRQNLLRLRGHRGVPKSSLRSLYTKGLQDLREVAPLLLVSPETASSMLPLRAGLFDVVVIDEASQMFVAEAMPMLFRAKRVVIAGDKQQMPPADFFAYSDSDEECDNEEDQADESTVLTAADGVFRLLDAADDAIPAGSHSRLSLLVHYRSERKELIEFSNHAFYEGELIIPAGNAPLPVFMQSAIEFENVAGEFLRGINEREGARIVELLRNIWIDPAHACPTVGVIVANTRQRDHVLELLQAAGDRDEKFRSAYERESERSSADEDVSFFVRSIEHVQGDERDLIIFALTYSGSSRRYGPLNAKNDGRKRLNVAVTRAKRGMIVLNSLNISHISNAAEKSTQERYYVWQYLRYARAVATRDTATVDSILNQLNENRARASTATTLSESPFEEDVKCFIESLGFHVDCQVGESGFRIDLGIRSTESSREYICGIECDGARYHSGWRARTSDVWRQEILESKGWRIFRVWSTDWFENSMATKTRLSNDLQALNTALDATTLLSQDQFTVNLVAMNPISSQRLSR
jgi:very-short-patch-repair endonuclease